MKKQHFKRIYGIILALLGLTANAAAYDFEVDGIGYTITSFTGLLTVTATAATENAASSLTIPSSVSFNGKELTVTEIGEGFAQNNTVITDVVAEPGVTTINNNAFQGCSNLATFIGNGIITIGESAFQGCSNLTTFTGNSIITIGNTAFQGCSNLITFTGNSITTTGESAFQGCSKLESITLPSLNRINSSTFAGCSSLGTVDLPQISQIGAMAFLNCTSLASFDVPPRVNSIEDYAFSGCTQLTNFIIPSSVTNLGLEVFDGCTGLKCVTIGRGISDLPWIFSGCNNLEEITIEDGSTDLECEFQFSSIPNLKKVYMGRNMYRSYETSSGCLPPFYGSNIHEITIGSLVTKFPYSYYFCWNENPYQGYYYTDAFRNCNHLSNVSILTWRLWSIPKSTFENCTSLKNITIPHSIREIESDAFNGCTNLDSISLGYNLQNIETDAFANCSALKNITLYSETPPTCGSFSNDAYINAVVNVPEGCLSAYQAAAPWENFWNIKEDASLIYRFEVDGIKYEKISPQEASLIDATQCQQSNLAINKVTFKSKEYSITQIGNAAFKGNSDLKNISLPDGLTSIGNNAFANCSNLTKITLPSGLSELGDALFSGCTSLSSLTIPEGVTRIGEETFYRCSGLTQITLPNSITEIGNSAFSGCSNLTQITLPSDLSEIGDNCFSNCNFSTFSIPGSVTTMGSNIFKSCNNLRELIIEPGTSALEIPNGEYDSKTDILKKTVNGKSIRYRITYYKGCFSGLPIEKLHINRNLSAKSRYTISGDGGVDQYEIHAYDGPFYQLPHLKELIIGENVSTLGPNTGHISEIDMDISSGSFGQCTSLRTVSVLNPTPPKGADFSSATYANGLLIVPAGAISAYQEADGWKEFARIVDTSTVLAKEIILDTLSVAMKEGEAIQINATVLPEDAVNKTVTWSSSDAEVATVSEAGLVTALRKGITTITATCDTATTTCEVKVQAIAQEIELNEVSLTLNEDETFQLEATVLPEDAVDKTVTWSSSDEDVATVSETGLVTALETGTAIITATCEGVTATCEVTVQAIAKEIELNEVSLTLNEDESFQLEATVLPEDAVDKTVTWSSSDKDVATVSKKGLVEAIEKGTAVITATCGDATATCEVTVMDKTGIEEILPDRNAKYTVYNLQGILVRRGCTLGELQDLPKGIYILTNGKERFKVAN